jgi:hypothetical protein
MALVRQRTLSVVGTTYTHMNVGSESNTGIPKSPHHWRKILYSIANVLGLLPANTPLNHSQSLKARKLALIALSKFAGLELACLARPASRNKLSNFRPAL